jgi:hypothetical protein
LSALSEASHLNPLDDIESALKTDVIDILRSCLDALANLDRPAAYEKVMNEPELLHDSFTLLRREPALFAKVITDDHGRPVEAKDEQPLRCGETLGYIKTLIVRASARRHFRHKLGGSRSVLVAAAGQGGLLQSLLQRVGLAKRPPQRKRRIPGKGDLLYRAMRDYLLYDWQARLIPHYSHLTPELVTNIGEAILNIREPTELRLLAGEEGRRSVAQKALPMFLGGAGQLLKANNGDAIDSDLLWKLWDQLALSRLFEQEDLAEARKIIAEVAATSKSAIKLLLPILGTDIRLFIVFLFVAYRQLGRNEYRNIFNDSGETQWMAKILAERLSRMGPLPVPELSEMTRAFTQILSAPPASS